MLPQACIRSPESHRVARDRSISIVSAAAGLGMAGFARPLVEATCQQQCQLLGLAAEVGLKPSHQLVPGGKQYPGHQRRRAGSNLLLSSRPAAPGYPHESMCESAMLNKGSAVCIARKTLAGPRCELWRVPPAS